MKLTEWYPPDIKPKRRGVYLTASYIKAAPDRGFWFQYWSGTYWKTRSDTIAGAYVLKEFKSAHQEVHWKGIEK